MDDVDLQAQLDEARAWARFYYTAATTRSLLWGEFGLVEDTEPAWLTEEPYGRSWDSAIYLNAMTAEKRQFWINKERPYSTTQNM